MELKDRGILPRYMKSWLIEKYGEDGLSKITKVLTPDAREMLLNSVPHEWYSSALIEEVYSVIQREFSADDPDVLISLGYFVGERSVKGFLSFLFRLASLETGLRRIKPLWEKFHKGGIASGELIERNGKQIRGLFKVEGARPGECSCKVINGILKYMIAATGATQVNVEKKTCIYKDDSFCSWEFQCVKE